LFLINEKVALVAAFREMFENLEKVLGSWTLRCNAFFKVNKILFFKKYFIIIFISKRKMKNK